MLALFCIICLNMELFNYCSYKMVDNKSNTSLIRHIWKKYITHEDEQDNTHAIHMHDIIIVCNIFFLYMSFEKFPLYLFLSGIILSLNVYYW